MIQYVLLDLDDTLLDFHAAECAALKETFAQLSVPLTDEMLARYSAINAAKWRLLEQGKLTRKQVMITRFVEFCTMHHLPFAAETVARIYERALSCQHQMIQDAEKTLKILSSTYTLYIASNGTAAIQNKRIQMAGIASYFADIFISQNLGSAKPSVSFFDACFAAMPLNSRSQTVMVGDSLSSDIQGGINAGLKTVWFDPLQVSKPADAPTPDAVIHTLTDLPCVLEKL